MDYLREKCPVFENNQVHLDIQTKVTARQPLKTKDCNDPELMKEANQNDEPLIAGLIKKEDLAPVFVESLDFVNTC